MVDNIESKKDHDLYDFMSGVELEIANEYRRIQKRSTEDPGTAGDQGEENWAELLRSWLPNTFTIVTKGRIIGSSGVPSPQIDVLVLSGCYPQKLIDKKLYLAGGVVAAFECKNTLKSVHIENAILTSKIVKQIDDQLEGTPYRDLQSPLLYGLLAHSHSWQGENSTPIENINSKMSSAESQIQHPRELLDIICVSDLAAWSRSKIIFIGTNMEKHHAGAIGTSMLNFAEEHPGRGDDVPFTPVRSLISNLYGKLVSHEPAIQRLNVYFSKLGVSGSGRSYIRNWPSSVLSEKSIRGIRNGNLQFDGFKFDEWNSSIH